MTWWRYINIIRDDDPDNTKNREYFSDLISSFSEESAGQKLATFLSGEQDYGLNYMYEAALEVLPSTHELPHSPDFREWLAGGPYRDNFQQRKELVEGVINDPSIPVPLRVEIAQGPISRPSRESLDTIFLSYKLFGKPVGRRIKNNILSMFSQGGLSDEDRFNTYREDLIRLYQQGSNKREAAERRVELIRRIAEVGRAPLLKNQDQYLSNLPLKTLEKYLSDSLELEELCPDVSLGLGNILESPYTQLGYKIGGTSTPRPYLRKLEESDYFDDRRLKKVLEGIVKEVSLPHEISQTSDPKALSTLVDFIESSFTIPIQFKEIRSKCSIGSIEDVRRVTNALRRPFVEDMFLIHDSILVDRRVVDVRISIPDNVRLTWNNPPESIKWYVMEYYVDHMKTVRESAIRKAGSYWSEVFSEMTAETPPEYREEKIAKMLEFMKNRDGHEIIPTIPRIGNILELESRKDGFYVNGALYGGRYYDMVPTVTARKLLERVSDYVDPFVEVNVESQEYPYGGDDYQHLIEQIRGLLRADAPTHLVYTALTPPRNGKGTHYIVAEDQTREINVFALPVVGSIPDVSVDADRYREVKAFSILRSAIDGFTGRFSPVSKEQMLSQIVKPSPFYAKIAVVYNSM